MNFSAKKKATFDEKGRVVLPSEFKNEMGGKIPDGQLVVEKDPYEKCLNIYPVEVWNENLDGIKAKLNRNNRRHRKLLDMIFESFKVITVPDSGRMNMPNWMLEEVGIEKEVMFVGVDDHVRLWSLEAYEDYRADGESYEDLYDSILGDGGE